MFFPTSKFPKETSPPTARVCYVCGMCPGEEVPDPSLWRVGGTPLWSVFASADILLFEIKEVQSIV